MSERSLYDALVDVVKSRMTVRAFDPSQAVPRGHYEMILDKSTTAGNIKVVLTGPQETRTLWLEAFSTDQICL